jgi:hypothetical protein
MLLLLNRITLADRGMVAPGHLVDEVFENTSPYLDAGAMFVPDTIDDRQWRKLVDTSTRMRLRGEDWGAIETYLVGWAAETVRSALEGDGLFQCVSLQHPGSRIDVPCPSIIVFPTPLPPGPALLMRGAYIGSRQYWAGTVMTDSDDREALLAAGCEFVPTSSVWIGTAAEQFAAQAQFARLTGAWSWDECEQHATTARLRYAQELCAQKIVQCPHGYFPPIGNCECNPIIG